MSFDANVAKMERTLGRSLSPEELRLLRLWELTSKGEARDREAVQQAAEPEMPKQLEYEGRFKIGFSRDHYEVYFVCATLLLKPVLIENKQDVLFFLTQDPINLDEFAVQQAMAAAENMKPAQIPHNIVLPEPMLRSMGFEH